MKARKVYKGNIEEENTYMPTKQALGYFSVHCTSIDSRHFGQEHDRTEWGQKSLSTSTPFSP